LEIVEGKKGTYKIFGGKELAKKP